MFELNLDAGANVDLDLVLQQFGRSTSLQPFWVDAWLGLDQHFQVVHRAITREHALVVRGQFAALEDQLFDLAGEHVHAANDHHVVAAAGDLFHAAHAWARSTWQQAREVTRAVTNDGQRFLGQAGEHQLTHFTIGHRLAGFGVDDLRVEVVFPDGWAVLGLDAFAGHTGAHHFGQTVNVHCIDACALFNRTAHVVRPRLGTKDTDAQ